MQINSAIQYAAFLIGHHILCLSASGFEAGRTLVKLEAEKVDLISANAFLNGGSFWLFLRNKEAGVVKVVFNSAFTEELKQGEFYLRKGKLRIKLSKKEESKLLTILKRLLDSERSEKAFSKPLDEVPNQQQQAWLDYRILKAAVKILEDRQRR